MTQRNFALVRRGQHTLCLYDVESVRALVAVYLDYRECDPGNVARRSLLRQRVETAYAGLKPARVGERCAEVIAIASSYLARADGTPVDAELPELEYHVYEYGPLTSAELAN